MSINKKSMSVERKWIDLHEEIENLYYRDALPNLRLFQIRYNNLKGTRIPMYFFKHVLGYKSDDTSVAELVSDLESSKGVIDGTEYIRSQAQSIRSQSRKRRRAYQLILEKLRGRTHTAPSNFKYNSIFY